MIRRTATTFLVAILVAASVAGATGAGQTNAAVAGTQLSPDDVLLEVALDEDGSATWTVEYRIRLDDDNVTAAFESVQSDMRENESQYAQPFGDRMRATAADAENATGREMAVENVTVTAERRQIPQEYGVIAYQFRWVGFAETDGTTIRAGDALSGFFLDNQTSLLISWPSGYELDTASPSPTETRERSVIWTGPTDFATSEPRVVLSEQTGGGTTPATTTAAGETSPGFSPLMLGLAVVALAAVAAVGIVYRRGGFSGGGGGDTADGPAARTQEPTPAESTASAPDADVGGDTPADEPADEAAAEPPEELLSNEERVLRLIRQRGGRMKQQEVAQALDWTDAKTSQVVRKMRDEGDLEAFRLGRENVLSLPDEDDGDAE
jgi:uncharacterized membrane protein